MCINGERRRSIKCTGGEEATWDRYQNKPRARVGEKLKIDAWVGGLFTSQECLKDPESQGRSGFFSGPRSLSIPFFSTSSASPTVKKSR